METPPGIQQTVNHLFRHESGKMVSVLSKLMGLQQIDIAQDIVQDTLLQALNTWPLKGMPDNPSAWLYRVARNKAIDTIRRNRSFRNVTDQYSYLLDSEYTLSKTVTQSFEEEQIQDSQLRMIFVCMHPAIPVTSQITLALKTLCGLHPAEIARAFLTTEETINKRIYRAKEKIRTEDIELKLPAAAELPARLDAVLHCLYLLFNEGYNSSTADQLIREDLCEEAMRLAYMLTLQPETNLPRTNAALALFCFQASRLRSRLDERGNIILLKYQDRNLWYRPLIQKGFDFLEKATREETSFYHLEAAIAYLHAAAPSFEATDWKAIYYLYEILYTHYPTPFVALNKAIAALYARDADTALTELYSIAELGDYYLFHTAIGEVYTILGRHTEAAEAYRRALPLIRTDSERQLVSQKLAELERVSPAR